MKTLTNFIKRQLGKRNIVVSNAMKGLGRERADFIWDGEYNRLSPLELVSRDIYEKNLQGSVAECGVYQGNFAKNINRAFPDRKLYLFDTFEGFDSRDSQVDARAGFSSGKQDFSKTGVDLVLQKMAYPQNVIIKKGYFPETAEGIDDEFVFVSLDMDLYKPMYDGLQFFYPRLRGGG